MVKCAKFAGREPETCTRGQACQCLNEPFGNPEQLDSLIRAYAEDSGWTEEFVRESLAEMPDGRGLVRWDDFRRGYIAALSQQRAEVEGWVLVPVRPTEEMAQAANEAPGISKKAARLAWCSMLVAAPSPEQEK